MRDDSLLLIARAQHGLLRRADVAEAGMTDGQWAYRLRTGAWLEIAPGVWHHAAVEPTWELRLRAGLLHLGPAAALFGRTSAAWLELDDAATDIVEFAVPRARRERQLPTFVHTTITWTTADIQVRRGLRVTSATRTILDLAAIGASARLIERAIDSAIRKRLTAVPVILHRAEQLASRGRKGTRLIHELLLDAGGESALERRFLRLMRLHRLPRPRCQVIFRDGTRTVARVDFLFASTRVIVEVSGRVGHASDADRRKDARRRNELTLSGFHVVEFTTADVVEDPEYVIATVCEALAKADRVAG